MTTTDPLCQTTSVEDVRLKAGQLHHSLLFIEPFHTDGAVQALLEDKVTKWHALEHFTWISYISKMTAIDTT